MPAANWLKIRSELDARRSTFLTAASFLLPLVLWCLVSYTPFIWHPDIRLEVSADRTDVVTVYAAGDHVPRDFFPEFAEAVRVQNRGISGDLPSASSRRANQKKLRHLGALAIENGLLVESDKTNDQAVMAVWRGLAGGTLVARSPALTEENIAIVRHNVGLLDDGQGGLAVPDAPLLNLIPQGKPANPVYLPAPDRVLNTGLRDFLSKPANGMPTMFERLGHSLRIVLGGFLISCLIGIPLGILCGTYSFFSRLFEPFIDFFRYMPAPAFSTLLVAIFAASDAPKIALVFIGTFFQLVLVVAKTTRQLDPALLEAAQTLGARQSQLLGRVVVPGILPDLYNDLRILLGWSWTWLVIAEMIGVKSGLTEFIETQGRFRNFDSVFPVIILIGVIGFLTDQALAFLRSVFFPWTSTAGPKTRAVADALTWLPRRTLEGYRRLPPYDRTPRTGKHRSQSAEDTP